MDVWCKYKGCVIWQLICICVYSFNHDYSMCHNMRLYLMLCMTYIYFCYNIACWTGRFSFIVAWNQKSDYNLDVFVTLDERTLCRAVIDVLTSAKTRSCLRVLELMNGHALWQPLHRLTGMRCWQPFGSQQQRGAKEKFIIFLLLLPYCDMQEDNVRLSAVWHLTACWRLMTGL